MPTLFRLKTQQNAKRTARVRQKPAVLYIFLHKSCRFTSGGLRQLTTTKLTLVLTRTDPQLFLKLLAQV